MPYLDTLLLLRNAPNQSWESATVAQRLSISEEAAIELRTALSAAGFIAVTEGEPRFYRYHPSSDELKQMIDRLAETSASDKSH